MLLVLIMVRIVLMPVHILTRHVVMRRVLIVMTHVHDGSTMDDALVAAHISVSRNSVMGGRDALMKRDVGWVRDRVMPGRRLMRSS